MINLDQFQAIFDINDTAERCRNVLDQIEPAMKNVFEQFVGELQAEDSFIRSYGVTLSTTFHDARNPNYAEQKKDSNIGRKYFIQLQRRVGSKEVNLLTLELNGIEKNVQVYIESNFYPVWQAIRVNRLKPILQKLDPSVSVYVKTGSYSKGKVARDEFENEIKQMIKPRKRPWIFWGFTLPLQGEMSQEQLQEQLQKAWLLLQDVRNYLLEEKQESVQADYLLNLYKNENVTETIQLLHHTYQLNFATVISESSSVDRQSFSIKDNEQLIVSGDMYYYEVVEKYAPQQVLAVRIDGHTHIFTNMRLLLGEGAEEWWIKKTFSTHSHNNAEIMQKAMNLLQAHAISVRNSEYYVGTYDNSTRSFTESINQIKNRLVTAAVIFAYASDKLQIPEGAPPSSENESDQLEPSTLEESNDSFVSNFYFSAVMEQFASSKFTFSTEIVRDLHLNLTALDEKHFVIVSGISGTGKTQLAKLYANAVYGLDYDASNPYFSIIPVRPDWTDSTALFGYYSSFEQQYIVPEFLRMVISAQQHRDKPHFVVLDEMNLARVEYYLSDYLSSVESKKEVPLHNRPDIQDIPSKIMIPPNLYLIGTVNVDETTFSISDKVLDRAFVMSLNDIDWEGFQRRMQAEFYQSITTEFHALRELYHLLKPHHMHFGYRSMNEMLLKLQQNLTLDEEYQMQRTQALEKAVIEKVFPKLRGDESIAKLLEQMKEWSSAQFGDTSELYIILERMEKELMRYGATQYWR